jgi:hypothetical protein
MTDDPKKPLRKVAEATVNIPNVVVLGSAAIGSLLLHSWPIIAVGGVAYGAMVAWDLVTDKKPKQQRRPDGLRDPSEYKDPGTQQAVRMIAGAKIEIDQALAATPADVEANLALALASIGELEERAAKLADRSDDLAGYLSKNDPRVAQQDVDQLTKRVQQTKDPEAKAQYEGALAAKKELVQTLVELGNARERIHATMLSIAATLEGLPAKIVRMRALDAHAMDKLGGDVKEELDRMNGEIRTFEETLRSLGDV